MIKKIGIVSSSTSNLNSVKNALLNLDHQTVLIEKPSDLKSCTHIILPGVGSFKSGMENLNIPAMRDVFNQILESQMPVLGICLGMQLFAKDSSEHGHHSGLQLIDGEIKKISTHTQNIKLPHVGWNKISHTCNSLLFKNIPNLSFFYFTHSYAYTNYNENLVSSYVMYSDIKIVSSIERENLFGVQFHPEKSQRNGLTLLRNFISIC